MKPLSEYLQLRVEPFEQVYKGGFLLFSMKTQISYAARNTVLPARILFLFLSLGHSTVQVPLLHKTLGRYCLLVSSLSEVSLTASQHAWYHPTGIRILFASPSRLYIDYLGLSRIQQPFNPTLLVLGGMLNVSPVFR
jgi:hypothetical protein